MFKIYFVTLLATTSFFTVDARADSPDFDAKMQPIVEAYLRIQSNLAADKLDQAKPAAEEIKGLIAGLDTKSVQCKHKDAYQQIPQQLKEGADKVATALDLASVRDAFKTLSRPMALWVGLADSKGVNVAYCSMAKGSWLQKGKDIKNPYYGSKMLACGELVSGPDAPKKQP